MSAFRGGGIISGVVDYGGKFVFLVNIPYAKSNGRDVIAWQNITMRLIGSTMPARIPSPNDLQKIAAYLDYTASGSRRYSQSSASKQLSAFLRHSQKAAA